MQLVGRLICADAADCDLVRRYLPEHIALTRAEPGCISFEVVQSAEAPLVWQVTERFVDAAAFEAHQARTQASEWYRATRHIQRDYRRSE